MKKINSERILLAASLLIQARKSGPIDDLPKNCRPKCIEDVYAIHDAVSIEFGPILGWKVGAASTTAEPVCAPILFGDLYNSPASLHPQAFTMRGIESEIAFKFATSLPLRNEPYLEETVLEAIEVAFPAIEICESRYKNAAVIDNMSILADNISNGALILGPSWIGWRNLQIDRQPVEVFFDDEIIISHCGGNKAGNVFRLLVWIANHLNYKGIGIKKGQVITTGSWTGIVNSGSARKVTSNFPGIGKVEATFKNNF